MLKRRNVVLLLTLVTLIGGLITGRALLFNLAYMLGFLLIVSFVWAWASINWVHLSRRTRSRRAQVGQPLEERFVIRNTGRIPKLWLELRDFSELPAHRASRVINYLRGNEQTSWRVQTLCQLRGRYMLGPIRIASSDPFGFFPMERDIHATSPLLVFPRTVEIQTFALPVGALPGGDALRRRTHYVTTNASGVRDYSPGDSFSRIHWRSSARRDRLIVKEFELDPMADIWIVPDMAVFGHVEPKDATFTHDPTQPLWTQMDDYEIPSSTEEYTITIAASLAQFFIRRNRNVGLMTFAQTHELLQPDRGERQMDKILETLAVVRAEGELAVEDVLQTHMQMFGRGTTLIVVTPTNSEKWGLTARQLMKRGLRVVTVLVDGKSFGGWAATDGLAHLLEANGLAVYTVRNEDNIAEALSVRPKGVQSFLS